MMKICGKSNDFSQIIAILCCSFVGICMGLSSCWTSPSIPELVSDEEKNITLTDASYFTVISSVTLLISGPYVSYLQNMFGRRTVVRFLAVPQLLAWITIYLAKNVWIIYINRVLDGVTSAIYYVALPVYICEISQPKVRALWGSTPTISSYFGVFLINVIGAYNNIQQTALICLGFPILHVLFSWVLPESPYYLVMKNKDDQARKSLQMLHWSGDIESELASLKLHVEKQTAEKGTLRELFTNECNLRALLICMIVRIAQLFSGCSAFEAYTQYMFEQAGSNFSSIIFTGALLICVILSAYLVNLFGRRNPMIFSCFGSGVVLAILTGYFATSQFAWINTAGISWVPLVGMLVYLTTFSVGLGTTPTVIMGELFSASIRGSAVSVMNVVNATGKLIVPKLFETLTDSIGMYAPFILFSASCFICGILSYFYVIETKGKELEEIQEELRGITSESSKDLTGAY